MLTAQHQAPAGDIAVIIPAYRPGPALVCIARELADLGFPAIIVVNDGSGPAYAPVFNSLSNIPAVRIVAHDSNQGKGAALKTGIETALRGNPDLLGVVTVDADGQHCPRDVRDIASALRTHPESLILGSRAFDRDVPLRSRVGNTLTRYLVRLLVGEKLQDTQTGLRAIPASFASSLLKLTSSGYDFELDMLIAARKNAMRVVEEPIQTIYEPGNKSSHFNPLIDSMKVYFVLARFCSVSLMTALIDNLVFYLIYHHWANLLGAQLAGRGTALAFRYLMVRNRVFRTGESHAVAFPRFLALNVLSGTASYGCIRLVTGASHLPVLAVKLAVEGVLFCVNFVVEREWVFSESKKLRRLTAALLWLLLIVPALLEGFAIPWARLLSQEIWTPLGLHHLWRYSVLFAVVSAPIALLFRRYFLAVVIAAVVAGSIRAVGIVPAGSVLLFLFSATVLGRLVIGRTLETRLALMAGLAMWTVGMTLAARLPIHYSATYLAILIVPLAIGYRESSRLAQEWLDLFRARSISIPQTLAFALLAFVLIAHWLMVLKPEASTDAMATHLTVPFDIARYHVFNPDFRQFTWALMPLGTDLCYGVLFVLGGEYAARLLNFAFLATTGVLLFQAARRFASPAVSLLMAALFLSTPLVQLVTGSLFVENFVAAMALAGVVALWRFWETVETRYLLLSATLLGTSVSLKLGAAAVAVVAIPFLIAAMPRPRGQLGALALLVGIAAIPYANAYWRSGNPVFPFANDRFHSPYIGNDLIDVRFHPPLSWRTPIQLTANTHDYFEGQDGSFGFQYLLLLPLTIAYVVSVRSFTGRSAAAIGLGGALIIAATQPNARYFYPVLPFLTVAAAASVAWLEPEHKGAFRFAIILATAAALCNIWFLPASNYHHKDFYSPPLLSALGRREYQEKAVPVRDVIAYLNRTAPTEPVFYPDGSQIAGLLAPAYRNSWHDYAFMKQVEASRTPRDLYRLLSGLGVRHMIVDHYAKDRAAPVAGIIDRCGAPEFRSGNFSAMSLRADCESRL
jgi:glycosyltransferase involved in cell wall biosynthesis